MNSATVNIRRMRQADLERVMGIAESLPQAPHWPQTAYRTALDAQGVPSRIALVAEAAGAVAGFTVARIVGPQAELETIAVAAESQRGGVAQRLFAALFEERSMAQVEEMLLEVRVSNDMALGFYRSLGFGEVGSRHRYYTDPIEDALVMRLRLK